MSRTSRVRVVLCTLSALAFLAVPVAATAAADTAGPDCVGLDCAGPGSPDYIPGAHGAVPEAAQIGDLIKQRESGFYELPAPVYQGDVQPQSVVYLSKPGDLARMPSDVRSLAATRGYEAFLKTNTVVVIDAGMFYIDPAEGAKASRRRAKAHAAHGSPWNLCVDQHFCVYDLQQFGGGPYQIHGPSHVGNGWYNWGSPYNNWSESMTNHRDNGDSLLADGYGGAGTRYCARQHSEDSTFANNPIGLNQASSFALLPSNIDRC